MTTARKSIMTVTLLATSPIWLTAGLFVALLVACVCVSELFSKEA